MITRRSIFASLSLSVLLHETSFAQSTPRTLVAKKGEAALLGTEKPKTAIWGYDGQVPGPVLRARQGEKFSLRLENQLEQPTNLHWHGVRVPNALELHTPIKKGESYLYEFTPPDAGTFWYHPHVHGTTGEQLDRGLYGVFIVEEINAPPFDREMIIVMDDWSLTSEGKIVESFKDPHDAAHAGRIGDLLLANNNSLLDIPVKRNERLRVRFVNTCNSKILWLKFQNLSPVMIAFDGQPSETYPLRNEQIVLGPGQRSDIVFDITQGFEEIRSIFISDGQNDKPLIRLVAGKENERPQPLALLPVLPPNPLPKEMNFSTAKRFDIVMGGGTNMGANGHSHTMSTWTLNGQSSDGHSGKPLFSVKKGTVVMLNLKNDTTFPHSIHTHGHSFRLLDGLDDGWKPYWLDSVVVPPKRSEKIAFVADNPGRWMLHCHMIEHQETGMTTWFEVV